MIDIPSWNISDRSRRMMRLQFGETKRDNKKEKQRREEKERQATTRRRRSVIFILCKRPSSWTRKTTMAIVGTAQTQLFTRRCYRRDEDEVKHRQ